ncbi:hypothetical protein [Deinococcus yunweiensis]|uniref:hypothetical protein n=1 Tax=Deinococcus yunweiensis TaxID=367282 RepID=UPI00398E59A4
MNNLTLSEFRKRMEINGSAYPTYAEKLRHIIEDFDGDENFYETDVFSRACGLIAYSAEVESPVGTLHGLDVLENVVIDITPGLETGDDVEEFVNDPLGWLAFWAPVVNATGRWHEWDALATREDKTALDERLRELGTADDVADYVARYLPDDVEFHTDFYTRLLERAEEVRFDVRPVLTGVVRGHGRSR